MRRSHMAACLAVTGMLAVPLSVRAQEQARTLSSVVMVGSRVRLHSSAMPGQIRGLVAALDQNTVTVATDGGVPVKVPLASLISLDASLGRHRKTLKGLAIGTGLGLALGAIWTVDPDDCGDYSENYCTRGDALATNAAGGAAMGAIIGFFIKRDRWSSVTLAPVLPQDGSLGFTAHIRL